MHRALSALLVSVILFCLICVPARAQDLTDLEAIEALMIQGKLSEARKTLQEQLRNNPQDDHARLALGLVQTFSSLEGVMQSLYNYGLQPSWANMVPVLRLPVPSNPNPEELTNEQYRRILERFAEDLNAVEATLSVIESDDVKIILRIGLIRLDFDSDGKATVDEALWKVFQRIIGGRRRIDQQTAEGFIVSMDKGDVHWLRGYCHFIQAFCEFQLAYDTQEVFDHTAQLFFPNAKVRHRFLREKSPGFINDIMDAVAMIHLIRLPVAEPHRLRAVHEHLRAMVVQSRASWEAILAETDDDREWIPNPSQKDGVIPNMPISEEMVQGWHEVLDEFEAILEGKKLIPFWRDAGGKGINLRRVFYEPRTFDLILWLQGSAAAPYLEEGDVSKQSFWRRIQRGFRGQLFMFAIWVN